MVKGYPAPDYRESDAKMQSKVRWRPVNGFIDAGNGFVAIGTGRSTCGIPTFTSNRNALINRKLKQIQTMAISAAMRPALFASIRSFAYEQVMHQTIEITSTICARVYQEALSCNNTRCDALSTNIHRRKYNTKNGQHRVRANFSAAGTWPKGIPIRFNHL